LTGLHTGHARIRDNMCRAGGLEGEREGIPGKVRRVNLQPEDTTIAEVLREQGYRTCLVNKWHVDGFDSPATPLDRGFDEFYGWLVREPRSQNFYPDVRWRNRERYEIPENQGGRRDDHNTDRSTREAIDFLKRNTQAPFFLYLAYNAPHVPLDAKEVSYYRQSGLPPNDQAYAALITHMDACIGQVLQVLREQGLADRTLVIFASDNGGAKAAGLQKLVPNGMLRGWKGELYEGGIRVPFIACWATHIRPNTVCSEPAYFPDLFPTWSALAGAAPRRTDGVNIWPLLSGQSRHLPDRWLYWEQYPAKGISQAVRYGPWKAIRLQPGTPWQLYNLSTDPSETKDLASRYPAIVKRLEKMADASHIPSENWPVSVEND